MKIYRHLLWIDGFAGAVAGVAVLLANTWLSRWYRLPSNLLLLIGVANLAYASYSLSLARRPTRPKNLIRLLVLANSVWTVICLRWAVIFADTASLFGLAHLVGEALLVGALACLEWRLQEQLQAA